MQAMLQEMRHNALNKVLVNWQAHGSVMDLAARCEASAVATADAVADERCRIEDMPSGPAKEAAWLHLDERQRRAEAEAEVAAVVEERGRVPDLPDGTEKHKARPNPRRDPETRTPNSDPDPGWEAEGRLHNQNARAHAALAVVDLDTERHRCLATLSIGTRSSPVSSGCMLPVVGHCRLEALPDSPAKHAAIEEPILPNLSSLALSLSLTLKELHDREHSAGVQVAQLDQQRWVDSFPEGLDSGQG